MLRARAQHRRQISRRFADGARLGERSARPLRAWPGPCRDLEQQTEVPFVRFVLNRPRRALRPARRDVAIPLRRPGGPPSGTSSRAPAFNGGEVRSLVASGLFRLGDLTARNPRAARSPSARRRRPSRCLPQHGRRECPAPHRDSATSPAATWWRLAACVPRCRGPSRCGRSRVEYAGVRKNGRVKRLWWLGSAVVGGWALGRLCRWGWRRATRCW